MAASPFSGQCNVTSDCSSALGEKQCYGNVPWSDLEFFCDCSSWYGYTGPSCDQLSFQVTYLRITLSVFIAWGLVLTVLYFRHLSGHFKWKRRGKGNERHLNPAFWVAALSAMGVFSILVSYVMQLPPAFDPNLFTVETYVEDSETIEDVTARFGKASANILTFGCCCYVMASLQISLSWLNLADKLKMVSMPRFPKLLKNFKITVVFLQVCYLILIGLFLLLNVFAAVGILTASLALVYAIFFFVGRKRFVAVIESVQKTNGTTDGSVEKSLRFTKTSSFITILLLFACVPPFLAFSIMINDWDERIPVGHFNYVLFFRDIVVLVGFLLFTFNLWYCDKVLNNLKRSSEESRARKRLRSEKHSRSVSKSFTASKTLEKPVSIFTSSNKSRKSSVKRVSMDSNASGGSSRSQPRRGSGLPYSKHRTLSGSEIRQKSIFGGIRSKTGNLQTVFDLEDEAEVVPKPGESRDNSFPSI